MHIAICFEGSLQGGGGILQQLSTLEQLHKLTGHKLTFFTFSQANASSLREHGFDSVCVADSRWNGVFRWLNRQEVLYGIGEHRWLQTHFERELFAHDIDLVYFLKPSVRALELREHNYIITEWCLGFRDQPEFPEVNFKRQFEFRENLHKKILLKAVAVLSDSPRGRDNIVRRYGLDSHRIKVAPFLPTENANGIINEAIKEKYSLADNYVYYPAQFWAHKNHVYLIDAIKMLSNEGIVVDAVFTGSDQGNMPYVREYAQRLGLADQIKILGFIDSIDVTSLYKKALAMAMPTYLGPTNLPPLEAFAIGTPVIYSDLPELIEQVAGAALLCDLRDPQSLATHIKSLMQNPQLREELVAAGRKRLKELTDYSLVDLLGAIFDDYACKLKTWKHSV